MNGILEIQEKDVKNFESVYRELIRQKVGIIYKIAQEKNENFIDLLNEFVPEANDFIEDWENEYIFEKKNSNTKDKPKKLTLNKKLVLKNNNNSIEETQVKTIESKLSDFTENNKMDIKVKADNSKYDTVDNLSRCENPELKKKKMPKYSAIKK